MVNELPKWGLVSFSSANRNPPATIKIFRLISVRIAGACKKAALVFDAGRPDKARGDPVLPSSAPSIAVAAGPRRPPAIGAARAVLVKDGSAGARRNVARIARI